jgi:hypothetical protein
MTTSFTRTRLQIADMVLRKLNVLAPGVTAASADTTIVFEALDLRLKELHRQGTFWRKVTSVPVTFSLTASVATASAGAGEILFPLKVTFSNGDEDDPVYIIGATEYAEIADKTRSGQPERVLWKGGSEFIFYPVPAADGTAKLLYEKIADDTSHGAAPDVEVSMMRHLKDIIAYDVADDFVQPEGKIARLERESMRAEKAIRALNAERKDYTAVAVDDFDGRPVDYQD